MRVRDGFEHLQKKANPGVDVELAGVAVPVDGLALDVFEDEVGLARGRHPGVEQAGDVGIGEPREQVALAPEPLLAGAAEQARVQELDGGAALEAAVVALREPHVAHAALTDERSQGPVADRLARERGRRRRRRRISLEKAFATGVAALVEQRLEIVGERRVTRAHPGEPCRTLLVGELHGFVEVGTDESPAVRARGRPCG